MLALYLPGQNILLPLLRKAVWKGASGKPDLTKEGKGFFSPRHFCPSWSCRMGASTQDTDRWIFRSVWWSMDLREERKQCGDGDTVKQCSGAQCRARPGSCVMLPFGKRVWEGNGKGAGALEAPLALSPLQAASIPQVHAFCAPYSLLSWAVAPQAPPFKITMKKWGAGWFNEHLSWNGTALRSQQAW